MEKLIQWMERVGAFFLFVIAITITISVALRYWFNWPLPDGDAVSRLLLSIVVFWGLAGACHHDDHIRVDLLWERLPKRARAWVGLFAQLFTLAAMVVLAWAAFDRIGAQHRSGETTYDLALPLWPFYAVAWLGMIATIVAIMGRLLVRRTGTSG